MDDLPVTRILPLLRAALIDSGRAVLQAPPGAGKTTLVPLDLLQSGHFPGRIVLLEPRRLAARAAAQRMADLLNEPLGQVIGYRIRGESMTSARTRIEVVTEGILTRMIQSDAALPGVSLLIFDEFHERSLHADLGLALSLQVRECLRPDLALLVMSATLDAGPVARLMGDAPVITAEGRAFPVETRWLKRPPDPSLRHEAALAALIRQALEETEGGVLVFLPGEGEIRRVETLLAGMAGITTCKLFGAMNPARQQEALGPVPGRKLVLASSIAETSLTIPDIRVVVDGGRARRARFDSASGMARLVTERVTRAEAEQRRGRAGRVAPGICYRFWTKGEEGGLSAWPPPEIEIADLAPLALELALWGANDLPFLTPPPLPGLSEARTLLTMLGALDGKGGITAHGRKLAALPLHPRLGHMLILAGKGAARLAALLGDRDPLREAGPDLMRRIEAIDHPPPEADHALVARIRAEAGRLSRLIGRDQWEIGQQEISTAGMLSLAYPDRIGLRREGQAARYLLANGKGAMVADQATFAQARLIVASNLDGNPREARIRQGLTLSEEEFRMIHAERIIWQEIVAWDRREERVIALKREMFGALILRERAWAEAPVEKLAEAAWEGVRALGLPWGDEAQRLRARITLARGDDWPDMTEAALLDNDAWLLPSLAGVRTGADIRALDLGDALRNLIGWQRMAEVDRMAPAHYLTALGRKVVIDYDGDYPSISLRLQEMFGVNAHPVVGQGRIPLRVVLLSPAGRPLQVTLDLPGFWANSYTEIRKEMRGRYPRHPWPEDPTKAEPTLRTKPRAR